MFWALQDLQSGFARVGLWLRLALTDIQQTYRRSLFGMAWIAFSFALFVLAKIFVFGSFVAGDSDYFSLWLSIGFWIWLLIQGGVVDGCNVFVNARSWILGTNLPLSTYVFQTLTRVIIRFFWSLPVIILIMTFYKWSPSLVWLWAIPGFLIVVMNIIWVTIFLGVLCARFRDLTHLTQSMMQVMFFLTPILYLPKMLGPRAILLNYNPFTHFLALIRGPLVDYTVPVLAWQVVGVITIVGWCIALIVFQKMGRKVPFMV